MEFISKSLKETTLLGKMFARTLSSGSVIISDGELGAGKTAFAKGVALGLGVKDIVNSPTFNIIKVYQAKKLEFVHIDAYRLEDSSANKEIGIDEYLGDENCISYIEWSKFIKEYIDKVAKDKLYHVSIEYLSNSNRKIRIEKEDE